MKNVPDLMKRLQRPQDMVDVVMDTDTYNEIDDQFAIAYLLHAQDRVRIQAICAAPFTNEKSSGPADGMERSYQEILHLLRLAHREEIFPLVFRGSERYLPGEGEPVDSPAARKIVELALAHTREKPLYILSIGAITNVASALLLEPAIKERVVIVWLGGHAHHWPHNREFNLYQDIAAARTVFDSGAAVVQLPCEGVVDKLSTSEAELSYWLHGKNELCTYLCENTIAEARRYAAGKPWTRVIWDISTVAWLLDTDCKMMDDCFVPAPIMTYDDHVAMDSRRHPICYVWNIHRDAVFEDLFRRLSEGQ